MSTFMGQKEKVSDQAEALGLYLEALFSRAALTLMKNRLN